MKNIYLTIIIILSHFSLLAQNFTVSGKISDDKGALIPFGTVYLKNATLGTSANAEGFYTLKIPSGKQDLIFRAVGYKLLIKQLNVTQNLELNVLLVDEIYQLKMLWLRQMVKTQHIKSLEKPSNKKRNI